MVKGTSISDSEAALTRILGATAERVQKQYGISIWFAEILGRRWSYIGGIQDKEGSLPADRIQLTDRYGFFSQQCRRLSLKDRKELIHLLRETIKSHGKG